MTALPTTVDAGSADLNSDRPTSPAAPKGPAAAPQAVSLKTWVAVVGANLGAFMAILNIQVVNASLADIRGAIGAGIDDGAWITTAYLDRKSVV